MARPKGTTRAKKPIMKKEFDRLINAVNKSLEIKSTTRPKLRRAFTILYLTGCRVSEIDTFTTNDIESMIELNEYSLTNATKTGKSRLISFDENRKEIEFLKKILPINGTSIFARNNSDKPMTVSGLTQLMNKFIHKILGELYSTHSFRSGYITTAHQLGFSLAHIKADIGHENIATTNRYIKVSYEEIAKGKNLRIL